MSIYISLSISKFIRRFIIVFSDSDFKYCLFYHDAGNE